MVRVFIGIPTLNRPEYVRQTVRSVLQQTNSDFRLIISDNCSAPEVVDSVEEWVRDVDDPRVSFHRQPEDNGEYGQGRFFFREARGQEFFMILHDDDVLEPSYLARAIPILEEHPELAFFVANPYVFDEDGETCRERTRRYLVDHGRTRRDEGKFDVLAAHLASGFAPISGTLFRLGALRESGFVDEDCEGNFPFELNVFLRLGEGGAQAWFCADQMLGFRFHRESLREGWMRRPEVVTATIKLLDGRSFSGRNERRRRVILSRLYRAAAFQRLQDGETGACRRNLLRAVRHNPLSARAWGAMPLGFMAPSLLRSMLPSPPEPRVAPKVRPPSGPTWRRAVAVLLPILLPLLGSCANIGARPDTVPVAPEVVETSQRFRKEYVLAPGDQIDVVVRRSPEVSRSVAVRPDGFISLPLLDDVQASGLTIAELDASLTEQFAQRLVEPEVTVIATNVREPKVYVIGEVTAPSAVPLREAPTALHAITLAGGMRVSAAKRDVAIIRLSADGYLRAITVPVEAIGQSGAYMALSVTLLQPDDVVFVPESGRSQFLRFTDDFILRPLATFNSLFSSFISFRLIQVLAGQ